MTVQEFEVPSFSRGKISTGLPPTQGRGASPFLGVTACLCKQRKLLPGNYTTLFADSTEMSRIR